MNNEIKQTIRKIQADLIRINNGETFFYNIGKYKQLGLIKETYKTVYSWGRKEKELNFCLTEKAKNYINIAI